MQACKNDKMLGYSLVAVGLCKFVPIYHNTTVHRLCFLQDKHYLVIFTEYDVIKNGELFIHWFEGDVPVSDMRLCRKPVNTRQKSAGLSSLRPSHTLHV